MATIEVNRENYVRYSEASLKAAIYMYKHKEENKDLPNKERQDIIWNKIVEIFNDSDFEVDEDGNGFYKTKKDD